MDAGSSKIPKIFVFDKSAASPSSVEDKTDPMFVGSRIGKLSINGKVKSAVIFYRIPIEQIMHQDPTIRDNARSLAETAVQHFIKMQMAYGLPLKAAQQLTGFAYVTDAVLHNVNALCPEKFQDYAVNKLKVPEIAASGQNIFDVRRAKDIARQIRKDVAEKKNARAAPKNPATSQMKTVPATLGQRPHTDNAARPPIRTDLPAPPIQTKGGLPKPLPEIPQNASKTPGASGASRRLKPLPTPPVITSASKPPNPPGKMPPATSRES